MTSPGADHADDAVAASARRRLPLAGLVVALVAASLGLVGWSLSADDGRATDRLAAVPSTTEAPTTTTAPPPVAEASPVVLPVPEDSPADAYAATPYVVHGTLDLPTIGVSQPLHEGVTLTAINHGPSHWPGTAMPGDVGNVVVAGHRTTYTRPFHDLDLLQPGDPLVFTMNDGTVFTYELTGTSVVGPDGMHIVDQTPAHTATLFACHPKGSAAQRIVGHFRLVDPAPA
jgi:sortase A